MPKRSGAAIAAAVAVGLMAPAAASAEAARSGYAAVNGLEMYYEVHGAGRPLVLLHGALMTIEGFGELLPSLAETRQVIAVEQQAHGRTTDIDRPLGYERMADDTAALLRQLGIGEADFFGYSMGGSVALQIAIRHPDLVRKLVIAASAFGKDGMYPEVLENIRNLKPEDFAGSPWQEAYARVAPDPEAGWPALVAKVVQLVGRFEGWPPEAIRSIEAPALVVVADADVVRPEHAVELFRLLGGVAGDLGGLPRSQLAVLPGTTHVSLVERAEWLTPMVAEFLDAPMPEAE